MTDPLAILKRLVAIPSVNPMGREEMEPAFGERRLTDFLETLFEGLGMPTERHPVAPGRENLYALLAGDVPPAEGGALLLFDAHQDTVPVDGMTVEPWMPTVRDGRLYGRGACDTKGGMAAMIAVLARLSRERPAAMPTILMACTVDEEYHLAGAPALARLWTQAASPLVTRAPDAAVVAEPTGLDVVVAHKGVIRWTCSMPGRAAHSSQPERGDNAIYKMARVLAALECYEKEVLSKSAAHPLCGNATINVGTIRGGTAINLVPDRCCIELEIRVPPGVDPESLRDDLVKYLARREPAASSLVHDPPYMLGLPLNDTNNHRVARHLEDAIRGVTGTCRRRGVSYATNAAFYAQAGTPSVVFGPGAIEQAHTADEWLPLDQFQQAVEILHRFVVSFGRGLLSR
jgi:acetylornithine deacetylase ArgE